jgi:hypothetical protein
MHVPIQRDEQRVDEFLTGVGFFVPGSHKGGLVGGKMLYEAGDFVFGLIEGVRHKRTLKSRGDELQCIVLPFVE